MTANYVQDARKVAPLAHYEDTDEDHLQFVKHWVEMKLDADQKIEEVDPDRLELWEDRADSLFRFANGRGSQARVNATLDMDDGQLVVFRIPGWFAADELGEWATWWFGSFQVAKQDDDDEWTAMCLSAIEPLSNRGEDAYFREPIEEEWIPLSLVEEGFEVHEEETEGHLIFERGLDSSTINRERGKKEEADMVFVGTKSTNYGNKLMIDSPYEAKDAIKGLSWDRFHPNWDGDHWTIDADPLWSAIEELTQQGWSVCVPEGLESQTCPDSMRADQYTPYLPEGDGE